MTSFWQVSFAVFTAVLAVYSILAVGMVAKRRCWITAIGQQQCLFIMVNIFMPCFILDRVMYSTAFSDLRNLFLPPLVGFGCILTGIIVAKCLVKIIPSGLTGLQTVKDRGTFAACVGTLNYGFVPIPLIATIFPADERLMGVLMVQNLGVEFAIWTIVVFSIVGKTSAAMWKRAVNTPTVAILLATGINVYSHSSMFPQVLTDVLPFFAWVKLTISILGTMAIPLSMFLVGCTFADHFHLRRMIQTAAKTAKIGLWSCVIRILILPSILMGVAIYALPWFGSVEMQRVLIIHAGMASAVFPIVLTEMYDGEPTVALDTIVSNSFVSLLTAPLWIACGLQMVGG